MPPPIPKNPDIKPPKDPNKNRMIKSVIDNIFESN
jgi:hypothetical protein